MTAAFDKMRFKNSFYPIIVISLCAAYLFYKYVLQIYPSVITEQLTREYNLTATGLGFLVGTYYYTYMFTQLVSGVLIDKYGARYLSSIALFCCAIGVLIFGNTHSLPVAALSRGLMGFGVAFATVAYMKLAAGWFPPRQYAFVGGLLASAAMAGAFCSQAPLSYMVDMLGWRQCLFVVGIIGLVLTLLFLFVVRDAPTDNPHSNVLESYRVEMKDILSVLKSKQNLLLTFYAGLAFSPIAIFGGCWGNPFLEQAYQLTKTETASMISLIFVGFGVGSPIIGILSDKLGNRRNVLIISTLIACAAVSAVIYLPLPTWLLMSALLLFGFALGAYMLVFAIGKELNLPLLTGTVIAMINASDPVITGITEPMIGKILDLTWAGGIENGVHIYTLQQYHLAMSVLPLYLLLGAILLIWVDND